MAVRVAINGFGRTGRAAFRAALESGADIDWIAINDAADPQMLAQLLEYDTVYGPFDGTVEAVDGAILINGSAIPTPMESDPRRLPWDVFGVDVGWRDDDLARRHWHTLPAAARMNPSRR